MEAEGYGLTWTKWRMCMAEECAVLADGCFWGVEDLVRG
jgi:hypothetical protein